MALADSNDFYRDDMEAKEAEAADSNEGRHDEAAEVAVVHTYAAVPTLRARGVPCQSHVREYIYL